MKKRTGALIAMPGCSVYGAIITLLWQWQSIPGELICGWFDSVKVLLIKSEWFANIACRYFVGVLQSINKASKKTPVNFRV